MGLLNSPTAETYRTWAECLQDFSELQIRIGVRKARDFTGYFNVPAFRELCRINHADLGLPKPIDAMHEACNATSPWENYRWSHPIVYHAAQSVGGWNIRNKDERELLVIFEDAYHKLVQRLLAGEPLDAPLPKALPEKVHVPADPNHAKDQLARIKAMIGAGQQEASTP